MDERERDGVSNAVGDHPLRLLLGRATSPVMAGRVSSLKQEYARTGERALAIARACYLGTVSSPRQVRGSGSRMRGATRAVQLVLLGRRDPPRRAGLSAALDAEQALSHHREVRQFHQEQPDRRGGVAPRGARTHPQATSRVLPSGIASKAQAHVVSWFISSHHRIDRSGTNSLTRIPEFSPGPRGTRSPTSMCWSSGTMRSALWRPRLSRRS